MIWSPILIELFCETKSQKTKNLFQIGAASHFRCSALTGDGVNEVQLFPHLSEQRSCQTSVQRIDVQLELFPRLICKHQSSSQNSTELQTLSIAKGFFFTFKNLFLKLQVFEGVVHAWKKGSQDDPNSNEKCFKCNILWCDIIWIDIFWCDIKWIDMQLYLYPTMHFGWQGKVRI